MLDLCLLEKVMKLSLKEDNSTVIQEKLLQFIEKDGILTLKKLLTSKDQVRITHIYSYF